MFDIDELKANYPSGLEGFYNTAIIVGKLKYEGEIKEIQNRSSGTIRNNFFFNQIYIVKQWKCLQIYIRERRIINEIYKEVDKANDVFTINMHAFYRV